MQDLSQESPARIVFVVTGLAAAGAEMMLLRLLQHLDRASVSPIVICLSDETKLVSAFQKAGAEVHVLGMAFPFGLIPGTIRFIRAIRQVKPDLIQGWMLHGNLFAVLGGLVTRTPVFWAVRHSALISGIEKRISRLLEWGLKWLSGRPSKIIYNSESGRRHHEERGYDPRRALVIPNGFDIDALAAARAERVHTRRQIGMERGELAIGLVARFHPIKGHGVFLRAADLLARRYEQVRFLLVGIDCNDQNPLIQALLRDNAARERMLCLGNRADALNVTAAFDIATSSSDPLALANAWDELIRLGEEGRAEMGRRGAERIATHFSIQSVARQFEALYLDETRDKPKH